MSEQVHVVTDLPTKAGRFTLKRVLVAAAVVTATAVVAKIARSETFASKEDETATPAA